MSWYEEWFDSPLYEKLYVDRNEEEAEKLANLIVKILPQHDYPRLVDVGCGRGRHSITLAERGYQVTGIDLSEQAITKAKNIAAERGLKNVKFHVQDMREPLKQTFDAALNLFTSFGYFQNHDENKKALESVNRMLNPGGLFLLDYLNAVKVENELVPAESGTYDNISYFIERFIREGCVYKLIRFTGDDLKKPEEYLERVQLFDKNWFSRSFQETGFKLINTFGDYSGGNFNEKTSPRLILLAQKL